MGFYELIYDCGDSNYCVDCVTSLDFNAKPYFLKICSKHKLEIGKVFVDYSLNDFIKKYSTKNYCKSGTVKVLDIKKHKNMSLVKLEVEDFDISTLSPSKIVYFSEFNDEPSFSIINNKTIIIDIFSDYKIKRKKNVDPNICYDWNKNDVYVLK